MDRCPICGGVQTAFFARRDGYDYVICRECSFVFLFPYPDESSLAAADDAAFGVGGDPKTISRMRRAMMRAFSRWPHFFRKDAIDVGCGGGFVTEAMRRLGARRAVGLDISPGSIAYARDAFPKAQFYAESFERFLARGETFDFILSFEMIEHIGAVKSYMAFLAGIARPGALIFLTTPDIGHPAVPKEVTVWDRFSPPSYVQFFTERTLTRLFDAYGFDIVRRYYKKRVPTLQVLARRRG